MDSHFLPTVLTLFLNFPDIIPSNPLMPQDPDVYLLARSGDQGSEGYSLPRDRILNLSTANNRQCNFCPVSGPHRLGCTKGQRYKLVHRELFLILKNQNQS